MSVRGALCATRLVTGTLIQARQTRGDARDMRRRRRPGRCLLAGDVGGSAQGHLTAWPKLAGCLQGKCMRNAKGVPCTDISAQRDLAGLMLCCNLSNGSALSCAGWHLWPSHCAAWRTSHIMTCRPCRATEP